MEMEITRKLIYDEEKTEKQKNRKKEKSMANVVSHTHR
jgi:hypothetical protein